MTTSAKGTFAIDMVPASADVDGDVKRVDFTKTFSGDLEATGPGVMHTGTQVLHYEVVPGSGEAELDGISGTFHLTIDGDGVHSYELVYDV
jgi:Protein of unknown function (DUF3224)